LSCRRPGHLSAAERNDGGDDPFASAPLAMATLPIADAAAATSNNSIGKEAIVRAGKPEMLAQRRPFVIAAKQATALQLGNDMRDEIL
jgi:hypothetical protein